MFFFCLGRTSFASDHCYKFPPEFSFVRQREEELLSYWWREYAECSEGPKGPTSSITEADLMQNPQISELYLVEEERVGVPVKGGLYEVSTSSVMLH